MILSDGIAQAPYTFVLNVVNTPPTYATVPANKTMNAGDILTYCMPNWADAEGGTISATVSGTLPGFASFNGTCFVYQPVVGTDGGSYNFAVVLSDGYLSTNYNFKLIVN